jgi:predicted DNA binding CopG/RHH family protein
MKNKYLDAEEKQLMESFDIVEPAEHPKPSEEEQRELKQAAKEFIRTEKKMNIRIDPYELEKIKERAAREGLRYQTFVKSILHKYITGQLVEK